MDGGEDDDGTDVSLHERYGYQLGGHGRWIAMHLKKPKKRGGGGKKKQVKGGGPIPSIQDFDDHDEEEPGEDGEETQASRVSPQPSSQTRSPVTTRPVPEPKRDDEVDPDDPNLTTPIPRYNAMLAVLRNTLYMSVLSFSIRFVVGPDHLCNV